MSGPPPPPPPPGPPPPPAMGPPALSKSEQHGRSALLGDISKGMKLKSTKHLMNDRSGLPSSLGGNQGGGGAGNRSGCENGRVSDGRPTAAGRTELICHPVPAPRTNAIGYSSSFSALRTDPRPPPTKPATPSHASVHHSRSLREKPLGPPPPPPPPPPSSAAAAALSASQPSPAAPSFLLPNGRGAPSSGVGTISGGGVRNAPPGLGDLFGGGMPKLRSSGSNTVGRSASRELDRVSNGSVDGFPPPPPPPGFGNSGSASVGRTTGSRMSGLPPPPSPSQLSRPLPGLPPPSGRPSLPSQPPPPPSRAPPVPRGVAPRQNGPTPAPGYNSNRVPPHAPTLPPKPPERKDSVPPPPPPLGRSGPPPPPTRAPPVIGPPPVRAPPMPGKGNAPGLPPHSGFHGNAPPPPIRPPNVQRSNSFASPVSEFEAMFKFSTDLPAPEPFYPSSKTYPSQNPNRKTSANVNRRPVPPPPPPGGP